MSTTQAMHPSTIKILGLMSDAAARRFVVMVAKRIGLTTTDYREAFGAYAAAVGERQARGLLVVAL